MSTLWGSLGGFSSGQIFDRSARALGFPNPQGPELGTRLVTPGDPAASGPTDITGDGTSGVGDVPQSVAAVESFLATGAAGVPGVASSSVGVESITGQVAQGVPPIAAAGVGSSILSGDIVGDGSAGVPDVASSAAGEVTNPIDVGIPDRSGGGSSLFPSDLYLGRKRRKPRKRGKQESPRDESPRSDVPRPERESRDAPEGVQPLEGGPAGAPARVRALPPLASHGLFDRPRDRAQNVVVEATPQMAGSVSQGPFVAPTSNLTGYTNDDNLVLALLLLDDD